MMYRKRHFRCLQFLAGAAVLLASQAQAQYAPPKDAGKLTVHTGVSKIVDAQGHVTYTDRPVTGADGAMPLKAGSFAPSSSISVPPKAAPAPVPAASSAIVEWAMKVQAQLDQAAGVNAKANQQIETQNCANAQQSLASLGAGGGRMIRQGEDGSTRYVEQDEIESDRSKAREMIARYCKQ